MACIVFLGQILRFTNLRLVLSGFKVLLAN